MQARRRHALPWVAVSLATTNVCNLCISTVRSLQRKLWLDFLSGATRDLAQRRDRVGSTPNADRCSSMKAVMTSVGGRVPSAQTTPTPCARSHSPAAVRGSHVRAPSGVLAHQWSGPAANQDRARPSEPSCSDSAPRNRSWLPRARWRPAAAGTRRHDRKPCARRAHALLVRTSGLSCDSPWLQSLKSWSLRQTRGGSVRPLYKVCCINNRLGLA